MLKIKILALLLVGLVLALQYRLWMADGGMREVWHLRQEVATQTEENAKLTERNRTLAAEVQDLKKGKAAIEERARTDLGMVGVNETFFQVAEGPVTPTPNEDAITPPATIGDDRNVLQAGDQRRPATGTRTPGLAVQAAK